MEYSQAELDKQLDHPEETSTGGLAELLIIGLCIVESVIALRMLARKVEKKPFRIDDFILVVCAVSSRILQLWRPIIQCGPDDLSLKFKNVVLMLTMITVWLL